MAEAQGTGPEPGTPGGYFGRALVVDVGTGGSWVLPLPPEVLRRTIGGSGLGTWLVDTLTPTIVDALHPDAPLVFAFSPFVGTPLTTSAKFAVVARSPLTGLLTDALASNHFALAGKLTGHDAIVLLGRADRPASIAVQGDRVRVLDATEQWGQSAATAETAVRHRLGPGWQVASIGPAGEAGVAFATISHDGRHAGRGGLGAVMGAKNVKALAVRASTKVGPADPTGVLAAARDLRDRSRGQATATYRELGTMANVLAFNALSTLPTRNFQQASFQGAAALATEELRLHHEVVKSSCASCTIGCAHAYRGKDGGKGVRMEYQSASSLGSLCGVSDAADVLAATSRCDELGLDTISAGGTIAWAMECAEAGLLDAPWLRFGSGPAVLRALEEIATGTELGQLLARGSRAAAELLGAGAEWACHVKGLELPGYEPRTLQAMALGLAVNPRGADHNRSGAYDSDLSGEHDRFHGGPAHVRAVIEAEDRAAAMDSLILCRFLAGVFEQPWVEWAQLLQLVTGWAVDAAALQETAAGIVLAKRAFNERAGWQPTDDWLPARFLAEQVTTASGRVATLTPQRLRTMVDAYWAARGLDADGRSV